MIKNWCRLGLSVLSLFFITSCSSVYMPNVPATPMFRNQGEGYLAGHVSLKGNLSGSAGLAVSDHMSVLINASSINNGRESNDYFKQNIVEGALGYFSTMGKNKLQVLEFYAGYGIGHTKDVDQRAVIGGYSPVESRIIDFNKIFVQVNYSSTKKKKINLFGEKRELNYGTAIRLSRIGMTNFELNDEMASLEENFFIEPVFFTRMQLVKDLQLQYTTGFNLGLFKNQHLKAGNAVFTLGVSYNFGKK